MKLLITTQAVDQDDPVLGFFHGWLEEFAKRFERVEVVCLKGGVYTLPANVQVHSLGKERMRGFLKRLRYSIKFLYLTWKLRKNYDAVFVHMNQEYVLLAGWFWAMLGKPVFLWRNHYAGSALTDLAASFCRTVFYTSAHSYTAKYRNAHKMPVGVAVERFEVPAERDLHSILFLARLAPSKRVELFIDALGILSAKGVSYTASLVGSALPEHEVYARGLQKKAQTLGEAIRITEGVTNEEAARLYAQHSIFVNASPSGMFDKTLFEAAAAGCVVLAVSDDFAKFAGERYQFRNAGELAAKVEQELAHATPEDRRRFQELAKSQSLNRLMNELEKTITRSV